MKKMISLFLVLFGLTACGSTYETINTDKALELMEKGAVVIDVRTAEEFAGGHIKGAINIPVDEINNILSNINKIISKIIYKNVFSI